MLLSAIRQVILILRNLFPKNLYQKLLKDIPDQVYTPRPIRHLLLRI